MGDEYKIEKLNVDNYRYWSMRAQGLLEIKGCWDAIDPGYDEVAEITDAMRVKDHKARSIIYMILSNESLDDISDCEYASDIWQTLKDIHTKYDTWHGLLLLKEFILSEKKSTESIATYLTRRNALYHKVRHAGFKFEDTVLAGLTILGLPKEYEFLSRSLRVDTGDLTMASIKAKLTEEERRIGFPRSDIDSIDSSVKALTVQTGNSRGRGRGRDRYNNDWRKAASVNRVNTGHSNAVRNETEVYRGKHTQQGEQRSNANRRCYLCLNFGHIARDCPGEAGNEKKPTLETSPRHMVAIAKTHQEEEKGDQSYIRQTALLAARELHKISNGIWVMDSGATEHMTSDKSKFVTFETHQTKVGVAGGGQLIAEGRGNVLIHLHKDCGGWAFTLMNTLYVPALEGNLLSASQMTDKKLEITLFQEKAEIRKDGILVAKGLREGKLYDFHEDNSLMISTSNGTRETLVMKANNGMSKKEDLWHRSLGHLHIAAIKQMSQPDGPRITIEEERISNNCETCMIGKLKTKPFPAKSMTRETKPLNLIHSDVVGPITPMSKGGNQYFVTFIDDHSRYTEVHMMQRKSQVEEMFEIYRKKVENYIGTSIKALRSDNGGEYMSRSFKEQLEEHGIDRQLTIPGTPQQNGVAERANQTLLDTARCMLLESKMHTRFWADAVNTAAYLRNRCPTKANDGKTPLEVWKKKTLDLSHLKVFGCRAWAKNKRRSGKFSPKGLACIFIGYDTRAKAYRLWNPSTDEVFISRDVTFEENIFPMTNKYEEAKQQNTSLEETIWQAMKIEKQRNDMTQNVNPNENAGDRIGNNVPENGSERSGSIVSETDDNEVEREERQLPEEEDRRQNEEERHATSERNASINSNSQKTRAGRQIKPPIWMQDYTDDIGEDPQCKYVYIEENTSDPQTAKQALSSKMQKEWKKAMEEEIENMLRNDTFELVARPKYQKAIRGKWIFKTKHDEKGNPVRRKARLVALGNTLRPGLDVEKTYAPVVQMKSTRILFGIAVEKNWNIQHLDITAAYLNADIEEETYMELPEYFEELSEELRTRFPKLLKSKDFNKDYVWRLNKSIYGLRQSGRLWNRHLDKFLKTHGLKRSLADPCVYYCDARKLIVTTYVDDLVLFGTTAQIEMLKKAAKEHFDVKDLGDIKYILSIRVRRTEGSILLDQSPYISELIKEMGMDDAKSVTTPPCLGTKYKKL